MRPIAFSVSTPLGGHTIVPAGVPIIEIPAPAHAALRARFGNHHGTLDASDLPLLEALLRGSPLATEIERLIDAIGQAGRVFVRVL